VLLDLQGPKLRVGTFANGPVKLIEGAAFRLDLDRDKPGDVQPSTAAPSGDLAALKPGAELLLDDGRLRLKVERCDARTSPRRRSSTAACCPTARA
jgi:pyruvate kinase